MAWHWEVLKPKEARRVIVEVDGEEHMLANGDCLGWVDSERKPDVPASPSLVIKVKEIV